MKTKFSTRMLALALILTLLVPMLVFHVSAEGNTVTFNLGANGSASHADGTSKTTYEETVNGYTLKITNGSKMYPGARDAKGNSAIKFGTSSATGSCEFTVPNDVTSVVLYVANYKTSTAKVTVNGTTHTLTKNSNDGEYDEIEVDTRSNKTVKFATVSGGVRAMLNRIDFVIAVDDSAKPIIEALNKLDVKMSLAYRYETSVETVTKPASTSDTLNLAFTGVPADPYTYVDWSGKTGASGAVYAGQNAGGNSSIQLRSKNSNSGIVSTTSGGKIQSIKVTWNSNTTDGRILEIYGKNEAYSAASELYSSTTQGTKIDSLTYSANGGATQTVTIEGDYAYIGIRSNDGAQYVDSIEIEWANGSGETESVETFYKNSSFALRFGVDKALVDIEGITSYGLVVSAGDKEVYFSTDAKSWKVDDKYCYVTVDLADIINDLTKLSTKFTVKAYVDVEGDKYFSENGKTYSVADMVKEYHDLDIAEVEPFYEYLVENGLINVGGN